MMKSLPPTEQLMDLLRKVRLYRVNLQRQARQLARARGGMVTYRDTLKGLVEHGMRVTDPYERVICFATAAELGMQVEVDAEECRQALSGRAGQPLRVLFWAAHRRMRARATALEPLR